jgi:hypothetical protein
MAGEGKGPQQPVTASEKVHGPKANPRPAGVDGALSAFGPPIRLRKA